MLASKKDGEFYPGQPLGGLTNCSAFFPYLLQVEITSLKRRQWVGNWGR